MKTLRQLLIICFCLSVVLLASDSHAQGDGIPQPIDIGGNAEGTITTPGEEITFLFDASSGDQITATVVALDDALAPILELSTFTRTLLAADDGTNNGTDITISYVIPANGSYLLNVRGANATTGSFEISLLSGIVQPAAEPSPTVETIFNQPTTAPAESTPEADAATTINFPNARLQSINIGASVSASLSGEDNFNLYSFIGLADQELTITPDPRTSFQPLLVLYDSGFNEIVRGQPGDTLRFTITDTNLYFIAAATVTPNNGGAFGFSLLEQSPQPATSNTPQNTLVYGDVVQGNISNSVPSERYQFRGSANDPVTFSMSTTEGDLDAFLILVDASGNLLAEDNDGGQTTDAQMSVTLPADGEYFILATRLGQEQGLTAGGYVLAITSSAPARPVSDSPTLPDDFVGLATIAFNQTLSGRITDVVFQETYVFFAEAGDAVDIAMNATDGSAIDPFLVLLDENRIPLTENDDDAGQNARIVTTLPQTGYYAIVATRFELDAGTSEGEYELTLSRPANSAVAGDLNVFDQLDPTRIVAGETPAGTFEPLRLAEVYTFSVAEGALIDFAVTPDNDSAIASVIITDSELNFVTASNNGIILAQTAPRSDDYLAFVAPRVGPAANVSSGFTVGLNADAVRAASAESAVAQTIAYGQTVRGSISDAQPQLRYVFLAREGDIVEISQTATGTQTLDTYLILEDANGNLIRENDDIDPGIIRNSFVRAEIPADGEYTIIATRYTGDTAPITEGEFQLALNFVDPIFASVDRQAIEIEYGQTQSSFIDDDLTLRFFYFLGTQGDTITIDVTKTEGNLDAILYLYGITSTGDFILLADNDDSPRGNTLDPFIEYTLRRTGGYLIAVTRFEDTDTPTTGSFTLQLLER